MSDALPDPPIAADVDLRDFSFMPLDVRRLLSSETWIEAADDPRLGHALMSLWAESWHQVPAGSLPDNDRVLQRLSMCPDAKEWRRIRERALLGWRRCSDGRLYHPVVVEKAQESWAHKVAQRERTALATAARERKRREKEEAIEKALRERDERANADARPDDVARDEGRDEQRDVERDVSRDVHQGTGTGTVKPKTPEATHPTHSTFGGSAGTDRVASPGDRDAQGQGGSDPTPARRGELAGLLRGLGVVCTYAHPTVCAWANGMAVSDDEAREAVAVARMRKPAPKPIPMAYLEPILAEMRNPPAGGATADPGLVARWWESEAGTQEQAARLGLTARGGEGWPEFRGRIRDALSQRRAAQ